MAVTAQDVKKLREMSGAGMMDCKKALVETGGDFDDAMEYLQKKGMAAAAKKADRVAAEGLIQDWTSEDGSRGVLVEVNCETDFVARNDQFQQFVEKAARLIGRSDVGSIEELDQVEAEGGQNLEAYTTAQVATIGENIQIRRFERFEADGGVVGSYIHAGGQIGVLVKLSVDGEASEETQELARDIAMHVAAMNPAYLSPDDVPEDVAQQQSEIFGAQVKNEGKPENIIPKIVEGKMRKWRNERSLLEQAFVKDTDQSVGKLAKAAGVTVTDFARFEVGEGIEKQESNLADEVAQLQKGG